MFDFASILDLAKIEPGHGLVQSILLFMIWLQSKGLRKEMHSLKEGLENTKTVIAQRFDRIESRLTLLENTQEGA